MNRYVNVATLKEELSKAPVWTSLAIEEIIDEFSTEIVHCKDCKYDHQCNHSVQRIISKQDYMSIIYVPIGWCERGERE